jgi:hypothetical protein
MAANHGNRRLRRAAHDMSRAIFILVDRVLEFQPKYISVWPGGDDFWTRAQIVTGTALPFGESPSPAESRFYSWNFGRAVVAGR